jgi:hypothetical protein
VQPVRDIVTANMDTLAAEIIEAKQRNDDLRTLMLRVDGDELFGPGAKGLWESLMQTGTKLMEHLGGTLGLSCMMGTMIRQVFVLEVLMSDKLNSAPYTVQRVLRTALPKHEMGDQNDQPEQENALSVNQLIGDKLVVISQLMEQLQDGWEGLQAELNLVTADDGWTIDEALTLHRSCAEVIGTTVYMYEAANVAAGGARVSLTAWWPWVADFIQQQHAQPFEALAAPADHNVEPRGEPVADSDVMSSNSADHSEIPGSIA